MRRVSSQFGSLTYRALFRKVEAKVEEKIGYIYLNSPADFNALSL